MYCSKCGSQNQDDATFCIKCGNNLISISPERKGIIGKLGKMGVPGFRSGKWWRMAIAIPIYLILALFLTAFIAAFLSPPQPTPMPILLITKNASEMALTINDMPSGWGKNDEGGNSTRWSVIFIKAVGGFYAEQLACSIIVLPSIDAAKQRFIEIKKEDENYRQMPLEYGDESFGYSYGPKARIVSRKANVLVSMVYIEPFGSPSIDAAKQYAEIVERKIS
jgi:hypothetical protein